MQELCSGMRPRALVSRNDCCWALFGSIACCERRLLRLPKRTRRTSVARWRAALDGKGFVTTGMQETEGAHKRDRPVLPLETSQPGVFAMWALARRSEARRAGCHGRRCRRRTDPRRARRAIGTQTSSPIAEADAKTPRGAHQRALSIDELRSCDGFGERHIHHAAVLPSHHAVEPAGSDEVDRVHAECRP